MRQESIFVCLLDFGSSSSDKSCLSLGSVYVDRAQQLALGQFRQVLLFIILHLITTRTWIRLSSQMWG